MNNNSSDSPQSNGSGFNYGALLAKATGSPKQQSNSSTATDDNNTNGSIQVTISDENAKLIASQVKDTAMQVVRSEGEKLREMAVQLRDGPISVRICSYAGGIIMVVTGFMSFIGKFFSLSMIGCLVQIYIFAFGWMIVFIEARNNMLPPAILNGIYEYAKFMTVVWGRGGFYFFCGTLAFCQWSLFDIFLGLYMMLLGAGMIYWGKTTVQKLRRLKGHWTSEHDLKRHFMEYDHDNSGGLDTHELAKMCKQLGAEMSTSELETCLMMLDTNRDGTISFPEFLHWYNNDTSMVYGIIGH